MYRSRSHLPRSQPEVIREMLGKHASSGYGGPKSGDQVNVLFGGRTPFALRPARREPDRFEVTGQCQVDLLMAGQTFLGPLPLHWEWINKKAAEGYYCDMYRDAYLDTRTSATQWDDSRWPCILGEDYPDRGSLETEGERSRTRGESIRL